MKLLVDINYKPVCKAGRTQSGWWGTGGVILIWIWLQERHSTCGAAVTQGEWERAFSLCAVRQHAKVSASLLEDSQHFLVIMERNKCTKNYLYMCIHWCIKAIWKDCKNVGAGQVHGSCSSCPLSPAPDLFCRLPLFSLFLLTKPSPMGSDCKIWGWDDQSDDGFFLDEN